MRTAIQFVLGVLAKSIGIPVGPRSLTDEAVGNSTYRWSGTIQTARTSNVAAMMTSINLSVAAGMKFIVGFAPSRSHFQNPDSSFSLALWKTEVDLNIAAIPGGFHVLDALIASGICQGIYLFDEPADTVGNWGGIPVTYEDLEACAAYIKATYWPNIRCLVGAGSAAQYLAARGALFTSVNGVVTQISTGPYGYDDIIDSCASEALTCQRLGLDCIISLNVIHGDDTVTLTPAELASRSGIILATPGVQGLVYWDWTQASVPVAGFWTDAATQAVIPGIIANARNRLVPPTLAPSAILLYLFHDLYANVRGPHAFNGWPRYGTGAVGTDPVGGYLVTDANGIMSSDGAGNWVVNGTPGTSDKLLTNQFFRPSGRAFLFRVATLASIGAGGLIRAGLSTLNNNGGLDLGFDYASTTTARIKTGTTAIDTFTVGAAPHDWAFIAMDVGGLLLSRAGGGAGAHTLQYVYSLRPLTSLSQTYAKFGLTAASAVNLTLQNYRCIDLGASYLSMSALCASLSTLYAAAPTNPQTGTMVADGMVAFTWSPGNAETLDIEIRRTAGPNGWVIRAASTAATNANTIKILEDVAGVLTQKGTSAQTFQKVITASTIAFTATTPGTITDSGNGLAGVKTGDVIVISGSSLNNGTYHVSTGNVAGTIRTTEATVAESVGASMSITEKYSIVILAVGQTIKVYVNNAATATYASAASNLTSTGLNASGFTGGELFFALPLSITLPSV